MPHLQFAIKESYPQNDQLVALPSVASERTLSKKESFYERLGC